jgi:hypothetical protein
MQFMGFHQAIRGSLVVGLRATSQSNQAPERNPRVSTTS